MMLWSACRRVGAASSYERSELETCAKSRRGHKTLVLALKELGLYVLEVNLG